MRKIFAVICWIEILWTSIAASSPLRGYHGAPITDPYDSVVINVNEGRTIKCRGKEPVTWVSEIINKFPDDINISNFTKSNSEDDSIIFTDEQYIYHSHLKLTSVSVQYVGFYYCVFKRLLEYGEDVDYERAVIDYEATSFYVFVKDPENLLVEPEHPFIHGRQYEPFVIPCKPTSPNIKVELMKDNEEVKEGLFDPRVGFKLVENEAVYEILICKGSSAEKDRKIDFSYDIALSAYIKKPILYSDTQGKAKNGMPFTITCEAEMNSDAPYTIKLFLPNGKEAESTDYLKLSQIEHDHNDKRKSKINLTITDALETRDKGDYTCRVIDYYNNTNSQTFGITFVDKQIFDINMTNPIITKKKSDAGANFHFQYFVYPEGHFEFYNNHNELIATDENVLKPTKYSVKIRKDDITFSVRYPGIEDHGNYTLVAYSGGEKVEKSVQLIVSEKPTCKMEDAYVMQGEEIHMVCECLAYPQAEIIWSFVPCQNLALWPECRQSKGISTDDEQNQDEAHRSQQSEIHQTSEIKFTASQPGTVRCKAKNKMGDDKIEARVQIVDILSPLIINGLEDEQKIAAGDSLSLECGAIVYNFTNKIQWLKDGEPVQSRNDLQIVENHTRFSYRKTLKFDDIKSEDAGEFTCEVEDRERNVHTSSAIVTVHEAGAPTIVTNFNQSSLSKPFGEALTLACFVSGLPTPTLSWNKDGDSFEVDENDTRILLLENGSTLAFTVLKPEDTGHYECIGENRIGRIVKEIDITVVAPSGQMSKAIVISVISIIILLVLLSLYLCMKVRRKKIQIAELKAAGLANFEEGNIESIDPDVNLDEQADLLPYDKKFEFPREKLKLGKQLGAGAFGVVVKAVAQGIVHYEEETTVAVKMVKKQTDNEVMKALVSELKIMIHLGQHLNVVNLLGAVTKNIAKRELMVIVEYCQFGNLQSFLVKHRPYFIDQVRNDKIDPMIMANELRWSKNSAYNSYNSQGLKYISVAFANDKISPKDHSYINSNGNRYINFSEGNQYTPHVGHVGVANPGKHMNTQGYVRHSGFQQIDSCNTEATVVSAATDGEETTLLSNNSEQPPWRSNYGMDYKGPARIVSTSDLVCWAFQVARGMEYLSSRKILHGDLAARNILLCEDNIVKICDFGLSKSMYKNDNYKRKGEAPLPFKWLSLEAISDHVFSVYSDIWSFGVVMWELFTLGKVPYTGMEANQELFYKLRDGYRMEKPKYATQDIYDIMLNCWNAKPESRPLFRELERKLSSFMMDSVKDHYLDLNEPYMQANTDNYQKGVRDYLTSISIPDGEAPMPPLAEEENFYVNNSAPDVNAPATPDYLSMSPKSGVVKYNLSKADYFRPDSPTITKNLDTSPKNKKNVNKKPELPEEMPMLSHNQNGLPAVDDVEAQKSYTDMSFSSSNNNENEAPEYKNLFATSENYVNIPATSKHSSIANPTYITFQSAKNKNH